MGSWRLLSEFVDGELQGVRPAGKFILWRSDSKTVECKPVEWKYVGNPQYAFTHWWSETSTILQGPRDDKNPSLRY